MDSRGLFLSENEYYVDENKKLFIMQSLKKIIYLERDKLNTYDKCYSIIKSRIFCISIRGRELVTALTYKIIKQGKERYFY